MCSTKCGNNLGQVLNIGDYQTNYGKHLGMGCGSRTVGISNTRTFVGPGEVLPLISVGD